MSRSWHLCTETNKATLQNTQDGLSGLRYQCVKAWPSDCHFISVGFMKITKQIFFHYLNTCEGLGKADWLSFLSSF